MALAVVLLRIHPVRLRSGAEDVLEGLAERRVAIGSEVGGIVVCLIGGAVRRPADHGLAIRRRELRVNVDRCKSSHVH